MKRKLQIDKSFYCMVFAVAIPIILENGFTNLVNLIDNVMVGKLGTEEMAGVGIITQIIYIFNLTIFGILSGPGIYTAQYFGSKDDEGIRFTFRYKVFVGALLTFVFIIIVSFFGSSLMSLYLHGNPSEGRLEATLGYGLEYLRIIRWSLPLFMIVQVYGTTLRECSETVTPMAAGITAVLANLFLNYCLIFGHLGFPAMGVKGAALATVFSRLLEALIMVIRAHVGRREAQLLKGVYKSLYVPAKLSKGITLKGLPLVANEFLWSSGLAVLIAIYSTRGIDSVAGFNISTTIVNFFNVVLASMGTTVGIIVGQDMGAGALEKAVDDDRRMILLTVALCIVLAVALFLLAPLFPLLYNTTDDARRIGMNAIRVAAVFTPVLAFKNTAYYTIRSGGRTLLTMIFDSGSVWMLNIPIALIVSRHSSMASYGIYACVEVTNLIQAFVGFVLVKKRTWLKKLVNEENRSTD